MTETGWRRYRSLWRATVEQEVDAEFAFHFQMRVEQFMANGMSRSDAERAARERYGDVAGVRSALVDIGSRKSRRADWGEWLGSVRQDVGVALRALRREPFFAAGVVFTLGLGIGANATMFGIIDRLMLRGPAHIVEANRVDRLYITARQGAAGIKTNSTVGYVTYAGLRDGAKSLAAVGAYTGTYPRSFGTGREARQVPVASVTWDLFPALGVHPVFGRFFDQTEDHPPRGSDVAVIAEGLWESEFGRAPTVLGQRITLGDESFVVVGVAPRGFTGPERVRTDVWLPMSLTAPRADWPTTYQAQWLKVVARLKPGVSPRQAGVEATTLLRAARNGLSATARRCEDPTDLLCHAGRGANASEDQLIASVRPLWYAGNGTPSAVANVSRWLMGVAVAVLLITCANVANLLLARSRRRRHEVGVRLALGAGGARVFRFVLTETLVVALAGAAMALLVAVAGGRLMQATLLSSIAWDGGAVDGRVFAFTLVIALVTGLLVGLAPALDATRVSLTNSLKTGSRDGGGQRLRLRASLSVLQSALCVVLLIGAGLFVRSLDRLRSVDLGFQPSRVIRAGLQFASSPPGSAERGRERVRQAEIMAGTMHQLQRLPWVEHAAIAVGSPYGNAFGVTLKVPGRDSVSDSGGGPFISAVTSDYFATVGTPLRRGRVFTPADRDGSAPVVIVNETMAKSLWPGEEALGKCLVIGDDSPPCSVVVGIVADVHLHSIREQASMQYYLPLGQERGFGGAVILVRPRGELVEAMAAVNRAFLSMPDVPYATTESLQSRIDPEFRPWQLGATMFGVFGALALIIAAVGLYSVIAYLVADRTREIGVRIALGASGERIVRDVVLGAIATTALGVVIGSAIAVAAGRFIEPLLYDVTTRNPSVLGGVAGLVLAIAILAAWAPARRASRVDPVVALRAE